jgi:hypothetical protein
VITSKRPLIPVVAAFAVTVAFALYGLLAGSAGAQSTATPKPDCSGNLISDPAGDQEGPEGIPVIAAGPNLDITNVFFRYDADPDAKSPLTANVQVTNLDKTVPTGASTLSWTVEWTVGSIVYYVKASVDGSGAESYTGGVDDPTNGLTEDLTTSGKFFPGSNGVIQIFVPQGPTKASDGNRLTESVAHSSIDVDLVASGVLFFSDSAPDNGGGRSYTVKQCPGGPGLKLPAELVTSTVKASKAKKGKTLSFRLTSQDALTDIKGTLKKGSKSYGSGKLGTLDVAGILKIKLKKSMKKGTYKLSLSGTTAAGPAKASFNVKVR